ncbi:hypothetical protein [Flavobacterium muglaense]|uniref:Uncharacterized protein n=1 Tax=Flavobacterium muglaense TaxID=2764716 RepID=A0A923SHZ9_9FLAO|nr:hypothetical protein [Flavobacterium muglaense]MBC5836303.1 hypothetical protein [Flavobacterium muglaense]MBC5842833.1 hypothetical protein [Flavobacterium muglaense]
MGFGFNLFFILIVIPLTAILLLAWGLSRKKVYGKTIGIIWIVIIGIIFIASTTTALTSKTKLNKKDYYGHYCIDRDYFPGKQADWQYENFRFEIKDNDSIYFYETDKEKIIKTYRGTISTTIPYSSARLIINMQQPSSHITTSNPTVYRGSWDFILVFNSPKFNNVYFKKGEWAPLE